MIMHLKKCNIVARMTCMNRESLYRWDICSVFFFPVKRKDTRAHFGFENVHVLDFASRAVF